jgi:hypothetical protein
MRCGWGVRCMGRSRFSGGDMKDKNILNTGFLVVDYVRRGMDVF